jgi:hypothetical protein
MKNRPEGRRVNVGLRYKATIPSVFYHWMMRMPLIMAISKTKPPPNLSTQAGEKAGEPAGRKRKNPRTFRLAGWCIFYGRDYAPTRVFSLFIYPLSRYTVKKYLPEWLYPIDTATL